MTLIKTHQKSQSQEWLPQLAFQGQKVGHLSKTCTVCTAPGSENPAPLPTHLKTGEKGGQDRSAPNQAEAAIPFLDVYPKEWGTGVQTDTCTRLSTAAPFTMAKR